LSYRLTKYAQSLAEFGSPFRLPHSQGHVLLRPIPRTEQVDAVSCYPLFACTSPSGLGRDLEELRRAGAVSLTLVTDPLGPFDPLHLGGLFQAVARPYKAHYLVDLDGDPAELGTAHHRRNARRCGRHATFGVCRQPSDHIDEWTALYEQLVERHGVTGIARFSRAAFARQLCLPGALLVQAVGDGGDLLGMQLWFTETDKAWHHLSGYSPAGYRHGGVSYGLMAFALAELKARGAVVADLGAGAGLEADETDGLSRFKQGWSTRTKEAWLCGAVLDAGLYDHLAGNQDTEFFPAYRDPRLENAPARNEAVHAHAD
jgi:hypothetical protein